MLPGQEKNKNRRFIPSSSTTATSSSSSLSLNHPIKTMEQVWKDINDETLSDFHNPSTDGIILQYFLARPFTKDPPSTSNIYPFGSPPSPILSLNSVRDEPNLELLPNHGSCFNGFVESSRSPGLLHSFERKRPPETEEQSGANRRFKRMVKNRESAARSRDRKQAHTNELELEIAKLMEENAMLKRQQEQICMEAASSQVSKKLSLRRTSTAPF